MEKPKMKRTVAISTSCPPQYYLSFYATDTIAECAKEFGRVRPFDNIKGKWVMNVDARFDFADVLAWLESFNE